MDFGPEDRVLAMCPVDEMPPIAARVSLLVGVLEGDAVYDARAALRDHPNTMIVPADPDDGTIPWKDAFFSVVYAPSVAEPTAEMLRVLAPGGSVVAAGGAVIKR